MSDTGAPRRRRKALLFVNPQSRGGRAGIDPAMERLRAADIETIDLTCRNPRDLSPCIIARSHEADGVILAGGDGTINAAAHALIETGLPLGVLPIGTANDFARSIGVAPDDLDGAARVIAEGRVHGIDVGEVNGHPFFNVASVGIAADLAKALTRDDKRRFGRFSYALSAIRLLLSASPFHATLLMDDEKVLVRTLQITIGNGRFYGGGNVVAADAKIDDGVLDLYSLEFSQVWRMALMIPTFKAGAHGNIREVRTARGASFEIITRRPKPVNADGELVTTTPAVFTQSRKQVNVYVPETCPLGATSFAA